jgi:hypothetical protein
MPDIERYENLVIGSGEAENDFLMKESLCSLE